MSEEVTKKKKIEDEYRRMILDQAQQMNYAEILAKLNEPSDPELWKLTPKDFKDLKAAGKKVQYETGTPRGRNHFYDSMIAARAAGKKVRKIFEEEYECVFTMGDDEELEKVIVTNEDKMDDEDEDLHEVYKREKLDLSEEDFKRLVAAGKRGAEACKKLRVQLEKSKRKIRGHNPTFIYITETEPEDKIDFTDIIDNIKILPDKPCAVCEKTEGCDCLTDEAWDW